MSTQCLLFLRSDVYYKFCSECHYIDYQVAMFITKSACSDCHYFIVVGILTEHFTANFNSVYCMYSIRLFYVNLMQIRELY